MYINNNSNNSNNTEFSSFNHNGHSPFYILTMFYTSTKTGDFVILGTKSWKCSTILRVWAIIDGVKRRTRVKLRKFILARIVLQYFKSLALNERLSFLEKGKLWDRDCIERIITFLSVFDSKH